MLVHLLDAELSIAGHPVLWREIVGNGFGLASAIGGMRRVVWAWPVGIVGNALLFTVFLGGVFHTPQALDLYGQAGCGSQRIAQIHIAPTERRRMQDLHG